MSTTRYEMVLVDRMSAPARSALGAVSRLRSGVRGLAQDLRGGLRGAVDSFGRGLASIQRGREGLTRGLRSDAVGLRSLTTSVSFGGAVAGALALVGALGVMGVMLGRNVVEAAAFRESTIASFEAVMGSSEAAGRSFRNAITIANQTPLDTRDVVGMYNRFATAGFGERELEPLTAAASDLASAFGDQAGSSFALVVSQMRAADRMDRGDLRQMLNAGINTGEVLDAIARQMNIQGRDERARRQNVLQAISRGQVRGNTGITAAMEAISARLDQRGALGGYARRQSETLTGALSNARNAWENLLLSMNTGESPGLRALARGVNAFTAAMSAQQPIGRELTGIVSDFTEIVAGGLFGGDATGAIEGVAFALRVARPYLRDFLRGVMDFGRGFGGGFTSALRPALELLGLLGDQGESTAGRWQRLGEGLGRLAAVFVLGVGVMVSAGVWMGNTFADFMGRVEATIAWFRTVPGLMVDGFVGSLRQHWARITDELGFLARELPEPIRRALGIRSPSRVMMSLGADTARGFELGLGQGQDRVGRAMSDLVGPVGAAPVAEAMAARGGASVSIVVNVTGATGDPDELGRRVGRGIVAELVDVLGALNAGPVPA